MNREAADTAASNGRIIAATVRFGGHRPPLQENAANERAMGIAESAERESGAEEEELIRKAGKQEGRNVDLVNRESRSR